MESEEYPRKADNRSDQLWGASEIGITQVETQTWDGHINLCSTRNNHYARQIITHITQSSLYVYAID